VRVTNLDWLPIEYAKRDLRPGSNQVVVLYRPTQDENDCYIEYVTSKPDYAASDNAPEAGYIARNFGRCMKISLIDALGLLIFIVSFSILMNFFWVHMLLL
jgi:hypothetical protein